MAPSTLMSFMVVERIFHVPSVVTGEALQYAFMLYLLGCPD